MNRMIASFLGLLVLCGVAKAQDAALAEQVNRLRVQVEDLQADKARQEKAINDLAREVDQLKAELRQAGQSASREDVTALSKTVEQLNRKHQADMEVVADQIEKLGRTPEPARPADAGPRRYDGPGFEYTISKGDTLSAIAKAYRDKLGLRVTVDDILRANPGLDPKRLQLGDVIVIPER